MKGKEEEDRRGRRGGGEEEEGGVEVRVLGQGGNNGGAADLASKRDDESRWERSGPPSAQEEDYYTARKSGRNERGERAFAPSPSSSSLLTSGPFGGAETQAFGVSVLGDPLSEWMRDRQRAFREFQSSFQPQHDGFSSRQPVLASTDFFDVSLSPRCPEITRGFVEQGGSLQDHSSSHSKEQREYPYSLSRVAVSTPISPKSPPIMLSARSDPNAELSPKAKVSYDEGKFQVEFDVQDYRPEELSIKTEGDVLVVLAKHETKTETGGSFVSKQFEQRFTLPSGVKPDAISSSLSKDGVLTVSAPRDLPRSTEVVSGYKRPSLLGSANNGGGNEVSELASGNVYSQSPSNQEEGLPHPRVKYDDDKFQIALDCAHYRPEELDVKVEGNSIIITAKQEVKEAGGTRTRVFEQKFTLPSGVRAEKVTSTIGRDGTLTITAPRGNATVPSSSINSSSIENRMDSVLSPSRWDEDFVRRDSAGLGSGLGGSGGRLGRGGEKDHLKHSILFDANERSNSIPSRDFFPPAPANDGISKVVMDDRDYKIQIDVADFKPEELVIKTVGNTVHFEAKHEEKTSDGHSFSSRNISQSFTLPRGVDPESVSSSMSKEGVLTISAPLPASMKALNSERMVPIKHH